MRLKREMVNDGSVRHRLPREMVDPPPQKHLGSGWTGLEQPGLLEDAPAHCKRVGLDGL